MLLALRLWGREGMELGSAGVSCLLDFGLTVLDQGEDEGVTQPVVSTFLQ